MADVASAQSGWDVLWSRVSGPSDIVTCISASERDQSVFTASLNGEGGYWSLKSGERAQRNRYGLVGLGKCSAFLESDSELLAGGQGIVSWNPFKNTYAQVVNWANNTVLSLDATPNGNLIAYITDDWILHLFDRGNAAEVGTWSNVQGPVRFSPDGRSLLTGINRSVELIDVASHHIIHRYAQFLNPPSALGFSPLRSDQIYVEDHGLFVLDTSGTVACQWPLSTEADNNAIAYSPGRQIIAAAIIGGIQLMKPSDSSVALIQTPMGATLLSFIGIDTIVVTGGSDVSLYSILQRTYLGSLNSHNWTIRNIAFSPDGNWLVSSSRDQSIMVWEAQSGIRKRLLTCDSVQSCLSVSRDASFIVSANSDTLRFWSKASDSAQVLFGHTGNIWSATFSPDDTSFVTTSESGEMFEWSAKSLEIIHRYDIAHAATFACYSHSGEMIGVPEGSDFVIWDRLTHQRMKTIPYTGFLLSAEFTSDDRRIVFGRAAPYQFEIHNLDNDSLTVATVSGNPWLYGMVLMPGDRNVAIPPLTDSIVRIFDCYTGKIVDSIYYAGEKITSAALNAVTGNVAIGCDDGTVVVLKSAASAGVQPWPMHSEEPLKAYANRGRITITPPSERGSVYVYRSDGRCFYSSQAQAGIANYITGPLPAGVYFVVFQSESGERRFAKVSMFE